MDKKQLQESDILEFTNDIYGEIENMAYRLEKELIKQKEKERKRLKKESKKQMEEDLKLSYKNYKNVYKGSITYEKEKGKYKIETQTICNEIEIVKRFYFDGKLIYDLSLKDLYDIESSVFRYNGNIRPLIIKHNFQINNIIQSVLSHNKIKLKTIGKIGVIEFDNDHFHFKQITEHLKKSVSKDLFNIAELCIYTLCVKDIERKYKVNLFNQDLK